MHYVFCKVGTDVLIQSGRLRNSGQALSHMFRPFHLSGRSITCCTVFIRHLSVSRINIGNGLGPVSQLQCVPVYSGALSNMTALSLQTIAGRHLISLHDSDGQNYCHTSLPLTQSDELSYELPLIL